MEKQCQNHEDMTNVNAVTDAIRVNRDILSKEKFYSVNSGPKYIIVTNSTLKNNEFVNIKWLLAEGHLWGFGQGIREKFFKDTAAYGKIPIRLGVPPELKFVSLGCGEDHIIGMTSNSDFFWERS